MTPGVNGLKKNVKHCIHPDPTFTSLFRIQVHFNGGMKKPLVLTFCMLLSAILE
jgi:hypothetical protein